MHHRLRFVIVTALLCASTWAQGSRSELCVVDIRAGTLSILDAATGHLLATLPCGPMPHEVVRAGRLAVVPTYGGRDLVVIDVAARKNVRRIRLPFQRLHGVCVLPDGKTVLVTAEQDRRLVRVDIASGVVKKTYDTGLKRPHMVITDPVGKHAFCASKPDGGISTIDLETGKVRTLATGPGAQGMAWRKNHHELWVANIGANTISIVDTDAWRVTAEIASGKYPVRLAFTDDGRLVLGSDYEGGTVSVYDVAERKRVRTIKLPVLSAGRARAHPLPPGRASFPSGAPMPVGLLAHGSRAYVACTRGGSVHEIDLATFKLTRSVFTGKEPDGLALFNATR